MLFWVHCSKQKPQVFTKSRRDTKKSLKLQPGSFIWRRRLCLSNDSLMCPSNVTFYCCDYGSRILLFSIVKPRLLTMARVFVINTVLILVPELLQILQPILRDYSTTSTALSMS